MREILELQLTLKSLYNCLQNTQTECQLKEDNLQLSTKYADRVSAERRQSTIVYKYADQVSAG